MNTRRRSMATAGAAVAACAACCAGPVLGALAAVSALTLIGVALAGFGALVAGTVAIGLIMRRRARRTCTTATGTPDVQLVAAPTRRAPHPLEHDHV